MPFDDQPRKRLADLFTSSQRTDLARTWRTTTASAEFGPIPPGKYACRVISGELFEAKSGTPGYRIRFEVVEGDHVGRKVWLDCWLTDPAMTNTKRDLEKLGITDIEMLDRPLPKGILAAVKVGIRKSDGGDEFNEVRSLEVVGVEAVEPDPFSPVDAEPEPTHVGNGKVEHLEF